MEVKSYMPLEVKADIDNRIIKGYAAVYDVVDHVGDIIEQGACKATIDAKFTKMPEGKSAIKVLYAHHGPIGLPVVMREDSKGLYTESRISKTALGDEVLELVRDSVIDKMSIGYVVRKSEAINEDAEHGGELKRRIFELELFEFGPLLWAANDHTSVEAVKSLHGLQRQLKAGGMPKAMIEQLAASLLTLHDALTLYSEADAVDDGDEPDDDTEGKGKKPAADEVKSQGFNSIIEQLKQFNASL